MEWIYVVSAVASSLAAVLAWAAKLWWGREFAAAKDEIIKAKDAQIEMLTREIESLRELTPMKIREYFLSVREQMEEYNDLLQNQLSEAQKELNRKQAEIDHLRMKGDKNLEAIERLETEKAEISSAVAKLQEELSELQKKHESGDVIVYRIPKINYQMFENINTSFKELSNYLSKDISKEMTNFSKIILENYDIMQQQEEFLKYVQQIRNSMAHSALLALEEGENKDDVDDSDDNDETDDDANNDIQPNPALS